MEKTFKEDEDLKIHRIGSKRMMKFIGPILKNKEQLNKKRERKKCFDYKDCLSDKESSNFCLDEDQLGYSKKFTASEKTNISRKSNTDSDGILEFRNGKIKEKKKTYKKSIKKLSKEALKIKKISSTKIKIRKNSSSSLASNFKSSFSELSNEDNILGLREIDNLAKIKQDTERIISESLKEIEKLKMEFFENEEKIGLEKSIYPDDCVPINTDIRKFDFDFFVEKQKEYADGKLFDIILMDPPWQLSSSQPTRGVAINYQSLNDSIIAEIPINNLQKDGFIFIWVINAKFKLALNLLKKWGYKYIDEIIWVKQTVNGKVAKGNGYYLQHTKETCLIGIKGNPIYNINIKSDIIFSKRRGQSQKPEEIYEIIESTIPNGYYLELFGRRNNLRSNWITIGDEL